MGPSRQSSGVPAFDPARPWDSVTLAMSGFHRAGAVRGGALRTVLRDWLGFMGGRPGEVVYVDGGSPAATTRRLSELLHEGLIDRLELLNPKHFENSYERCYIQEYRAGRLATLPYVMFVKLDMLPFRRGAEGWLAEDLAALDRPGVFAVTTTHLIDPPSGREGPYRIYDFASLNFALMKRSAWEEAMRGEIGGFIDANFRGAFPEHLNVEERWRRALVEWAWQAHCRRHGLRTLARAESADWTVFHINKSGRKLLEYRRRYLAREGIEEHLDRSKGLYRPPLRVWQRTGRAIEGLVRGLKGARRREAPR